MRSLPVANSTRYRRVKSGGNITAENISVSMPIRSSAIKKGQEESRDSDHPGIDVTLQDSFVSSGGPEKRVCTGGRRTRAVPKKHRLVSSSGLGAESTGCWVWTEKIWRRFGTEQGGQDKRILRTPFKSECLVFLVRKKVEKSW